MAQLIAAKPKNVSFDKTLNAFSFSFFLQKEHIKNISKDPAVKTAQIAVTGFGKYALFNFKENSPYSRAKKTPNATRHATAPKNNAHKEKVRV